MRHRAATLVALGAWAALAGCGTAVLKHTTRVNVSDPGGRMGPPPWRVWIFDPTSGYSGSAAWALPQAGTTRPGHPYVDALSQHVTKWAFDFTRPRRMEIGLFLPALTDKGWFRAEVELDGRDRWSGEGRYCNWGSLHYDAGTEVVLVDVVAHENGRTWALDVTAHVPPTPRTSAAPASWGSGQPNTSPSPSPP